MVESLEPSQTASICRDTHSGGNGQSIRQAAALIYIKTCYVNPIILMWFKDESHILEVPLTCIPTQCHPTTQALQSSRSEQSQPSHRRWWTCDCKVEVDTKSRCQIFNTKILDNPHVLQKYLCYCESIEKCFLSPWKSMETRFTLERIVENIVGASRSRPVDDNKLTENLIIRNP